MKKTAGRLISACILAASVTLPVFSDPAERETGIPDEIRTYYDTLNFIAGSSTQYERIALAGGVVGRNGTKMDPVRRGALMAAMEAVERMELRQEPGMPNPFELKGGELNPARWMHALAWSVPEIVTVSEKQAVFRVRMQYSDPGALNIPADDGTFPGSGFQDPEKKLRSGAVMGRELHEWILTEKGWKRLPLLYVLVGE